MQEEIKIESEHNPITLEQMEQRLKDIIRQSQKRISRIFSVQFHKVLPEEILNKTVSFKIENTDNNKSTVSTFRSWL